MGGHACLSVKGVEMMLGRKKSLEHRGGNYKDHSYIACNAEFIGDVRFVGGLHVEGRIKGSILSDDGTVHVHGEMVGEVRVPNVVINGIVTGDVYAGVHLELLPKARVVGNIYYKTMEMAVGAQINGALVAISEGQVIEGRIAGALPAAEKG